MTIADSVIGSINRTVPIETRLQRLCKYRHVRRILRVVLRLLATKIWISSNRQRQCANG